MAAVANLIYTISSNKSCDSSCAGSKNAAKKVHLADAIALFFSLFKCAFFVPNPNFYNSMSKCDWPQVTPLQENMQSRP